MPTSLMHDAFCGVYDLNSSLPLETQTDRIRSEKPNRLFHQSKLNSLSFQNPSILRIVLSEYDVNHQLSSL